MDPTLAQVPLVVFAVPEETRPFMRCFAPRGLLAGSKGLRQRRGAVGREDFWPALRVLTTGMGVKNTRLAFEDAYAAAAPKLVLTCGFAGGLDLRLANGTVVFDADESFSLMDRLVAAGAQPARFHCADRVAVTVAEKAELRRATGADAVEMESSVIRALCRERGLPSATVRVISDAADEALPLDFNTLMTAELKLHFGKLAWRLARSPGKIPELMRFQQRVGFAADQLAKVLAQVLSK